MPGSSKDVFLSTSLFKSIKNKYKDHNLYVSTKPENFAYYTGMITFIKLFLTESFDHVLGLEGAGDNEGHISVSFLPLI